MTLPLSSSTIPRVAVLLATYNGSKYVLQQVATILSQIQVTVDIYIRDDGSSDSTLQLLKTISDPRVFILENTSFIESSRESGAALNFYRLICSKSFVVSDYDWFAFADQDDIWFPSKFTKAIQECENAGASACSSSILAFWPDSGKSYLIPKQGHASSLNHLFESPGPGCTFLLRSDVFASLQSFIRENFDSIVRIEFHDWLIYAFVVNRFRTWYISPFVSMLYQQHGANVAGAGLSLKQLRNKISLVYSGWYRGQVLLISSLLISDAPLAVRLLERMGIWDRLRLPFVIWPHRRRLKDRVMLSVILPFSRLKTPFSRVF